jgi:hypothetical protein
VAFFQSLGIVALFNVISSILARNGIFASPPSFRISPGMLSGPADLLLLIAATLFLISLVLIMKVLTELAD